MKKAPTRWPYQVQSYSVSAAAWMPVKPPPARMYRSNAACWVLLSGSPVVDRNTTVS
jgi:hypothetical protein